MPKVQNATIDDLAATKAELDAQIKSTSTAVERKLAKTIEDLQQQVRQLASEVENQQAQAQQARERIANDAKVQAKSAAAEVSAKVDEMVQAASAAREQNKADLVDMLQQAEARTLEKLAKEITDLCENFEKELKDTSAEMNESIQQMGMGAAEEMVKTRDQILGTLSNFMKKPEVDQAIQEALEAESTKLKEDMKKTQNKTLERSREVESEIHLKVDQGIDRLQELIDLNQEFAVTEHKDIREKSGQSLGEFKDTASKQLEFLTDQAEKTRAAVSEVENLSTRRVDWVIKNVSRVLRPRTPSKAASLHTSWFSPKFDAAGAHGLQLELQVYRPSDPPVQDEAEGDCALYLWACKGTSLVYKLAIGSKSATLEKVFNGRVPFGTKRLCFLRNQINREEDSLRVSLEVLECVREIVHIIEPPPPPATLEDAKAEQEEIEGKGSCPLEGSINLRRHWNNRLLDQVKTQVQVMQSRMIRRIEWRLEHASMLQRCFQSGDPMCSPTFSAAGIETLQLMFYPQGYTGATDGYCSIYLYAPAGVTLKTTLHAGTQKRDCSNFFETSGAFGRTNFCRFESCVDEEDDTVLIAMDVHEAHQDIKATVSHPAVQPGDRRSQSAMDGSAAVGVNSVIKMQRNPGKLTEGLEDMRVLPSLWSAKPISENKGVDLGFRGFDDLKGQSQMSGASPLRGGLSQMSQMSRKTESIREGEGAYPSPGAGGTARGDFGLKPKKGLRASKSAGSTMQLLQAAGGQV